jgi:hypothetical protein
MLALLGISLFAIGVVSSNPPDISGNWQGDEWGQVTLTQTAQSEYTGTYTDTVGTVGPGKIELKWSRIERRFNGTWREGDDDRFGDLSVRLVDKEIRGAITTDSKSKINPATPRLADLVWTKAGPKSLALLYEVQSDSKQRAITANDIDELLRVLDRRLNSGGEKLARLRKLDDGRIEVILLRTSDADRRRVERLLARHGTVEFRILADPQKDERVATDAQYERSVSEDKKRVVISLRTELRDASGKRLAWWVPVKGRPESEFYNPGATVNRRLEIPQGHTYDEVLVLADPYNVTSDYIIKAEVGSVGGSPCINVALNDAGSKLLAKLTGEHQPDARSGKASRLGIIIDGELWSWPKLKAVISDRAQITGDFSREEAAEAADVLNAGRLSPRLRLLANQGPAHSTTPFGGSAPHAGAVQFDGNHYAKLDPPPKFTSGDFTISLWFNPVRRTDHFAFPFMRGYSYRDQQGDIGMKLNRDSGDLNFQARTADGRWLFGWDIPESRLRGPVRYGQWNHVVVQRFHEYTQDGGIIHYTMWMNGARVGTEKSSADISDADNTNPLIVGGIMENNEPVDLFQGALDDFRIFRRCLSDGEITELYQSNGDTAFQNGEGRLPIGPLRTVNWKAIQLPREGLLSSPSEDANHANAEPPWGKWNDGWGIRLRPDKADWLQGETPEFTFDVRRLDSPETNGQGRLTLNLGSVIGNTKTIRPDAIRLVLIDSKEKSIELSYQQGRVGGRVDDFIVRVAAGSTYSLHLSLADYWCPANKEFRVDRLPPDEYRVLAVLDSKAPQHVNSGVKPDMTHLWKGTLTSNQATIRVEPPKVRGRTRSAVSSRWFSAGPAYEELNRLVSPHGIQVSSYNHSVDHYRTILSESQPGSTIVLLFALDHPDKVIPAEYQDLLPMPWEKIEATLRKGETIEMTGSLRERKIVLLAAPTVAQLIERIHKTKLLSDNSAMPVQPANNLEVAQARFNAAKTKAENDIAVRYAIAATDVAKREYEFNKKANEQVPGSVPKARLLELEAKCTETDLAIDLAKLNKQLAAEDFEIAKAELDFAHGNGDLASDEARRDTDIAEAKYIAARAKADNDINVRYAMAAAAVTKKEYDYNVDAEKQVPGAIPKAKLEELSLRCKEADLVLEKANYQHRTDIDAAKIAKAELDAARRKAAEIKPVPK